MKFNKKYFYQGKSKSQLRGRYIAVTFGIVGILVMFILMLLFQL